VLCGGGLCWGGATTTVSWVFVGGTGGRGPGRCGDWSGAGEGLASGGEATPGRRRQGVPRPTAHQRRPAGERRPPERGGGAGRGRGGKGSAPQRQAARGADGRPEQSSAREEGGARGGRAGSDGAEEDAPPARRERGTPAARQKNGRRTADRRRREGRRSPLRGGGGPPQCAFAQMRKRGGRSGTEEQCPCPVGGPGSMSPSPPKTGQPSRSERKETQTREWREARPHFAAWRFTTTNRLPSVGIKRKLDWELGDQQLVSASGVVGMSTPIPARATPRRERRRRPPQLSR